jgi:hypothetical protein
MALPRTIPYSATIIFDQKSSTWSVVEVLSLTEDAQGGFPLYRDPLHVPGGSGDLADRRLLLADLGLEGWSIQGVERGLLQLERKWQRGDATRLFPFSTVQEFPLLKGVRRLRPAEGSRVLIRSPRAMIAASYPSPEKREDTLNNDEEILRVPFFGEYSEDPLRLQTVSVLVRNKIVATITKIILWPPLKWLLLTFCAIFGKQITEQALVPAAKRIMQFLKLRYTEGQTHS